MQQSNDKKFIITLTRSLIGTSPNQRKTAKALGLRRRGARRSHDINPVIKGMIRKIEHLVQVTSS